MKKFITITMVLALTLLSFQYASAQLIDTTELSAITDSVGKTANLSHVDIGVVVASVIKMILGLLATVFLILVVMAGIRWMTAEGNEEAVSKSKKSLKTAIIGLIIVLAAYAITYFIFQVLPFGSGSMPNPI